MESQIITQIVISIATALAVAFLLWQGASLRKRLSLWKNGSAVYQWLKQNTQDEPGESHKTVDEISNGTRLSLDEVLDACRHNRKIFRSTSGEYGIWRKEAQSVYEKRGLR
jgi:hypothetical protein